VTLHASRGVETRIVIRRRGSFGAGAAAIRDDQLPCRCRALVAACGPWAFTGGERSFKGPPPRHGLLVEEGAAGHLLVTLWVMAVG
jgi:hypothetical protein